VRKILCALRGERNTAFKRGKKSNSPSCYKRPAILSGITDFSH